LFPALTSGLRILSALRCGERWADAYGMFDEERCLHHFEQHRTLQEREERSSLIVRDSPQSFAVDVRTEGYERISIM